MAHFPKDKLLEIVKAHAVANYDKGWDILVETMSDDEVLKLIGRSTTDYGAIRLVWKKLRPVVSHRKEVQSTAE